MVESIGTYSFRLLDKANAINLSLNNTAPKLNTVPITDGFTALDSGTISGNFNTFSNNQGLDADLYSFSGQAGELFYLHNTPLTHNDWILYAPDGQYISTGNLINDGELTLSTTGQYLLVMEGVGSGSSYSFDLDLYPQQPSQALTLNQVVNGNISLPGENDAYTFSGTAGQQLYYNALVGGNPNFTIRLYAPSRRQICSGPVQNNNGPDNIILTETGQYSLVIDGNGAATGAYTFRLLDKATGATNLSVNPVPITDGFTTLDTGVIKGNFNTFSNNQILDGDLYSFSGMQESYFTCTIYKAPTTIGYYMHQMGKSLVVTTYITMMN